MVEVGGRGRWLTHLVLIFGVAVFALPIYMALIGSTHDVGTIGRGRLAAVPGRPSRPRTPASLDAGERPAAPGTPVARMMANSLVMATGHRRREDRRSPILSAFAIVFFDFRRACSSSG